MKRFSFILFISLWLAACAPAATGNSVQQPEPATGEAISTPAGGQVAIPTLSPNTSSGDSLTRLDGQGMVTVEVTPTDLSAGAETLSFEIVMNTHSVDLGMDLGTLSTLTTDTGVSVPASKWDAPPGGGHHVSGTLIFPSAQDGSSVLEGATRLTLTILNVDAPARVFEWDL